jgi:GT2 family glycosyltransferase
LADTATNGTPALAVIVLSYKGRPTLGAAVRSLLEQDYKAEIVVAHSGGGDVRGQLSAAGIDVRVVESERRLFPGGARNLGIAATRAPYVAFLADDCIAEPGWASQRLRAHREGAAAVASALLCHRPDNPVALAAHLSLFIRRMPGIEPSLALTYGASYERRLFEAHGAFREDLEGGEDTEFNLRLETRDEPIWRPEIRTIHVGAETLGSFLSSQFRRGRRMARAWREIGTYSAGRVAADAIERTGFIIRHASGVVEPRRRWTAVLSMPLIVLGNLVYALGALTAGKRA